MKIKSISSETNSSLKLIRSLHRRQAREKERLFLLEGAHCLIEACKKNLALKVIVASQNYLEQGMEEIRQLDIDEISVVEDQVFSELATTTSSCGILAVAEMPRQKQTDISLWSPSVIAVADGIQDPGNLGTLIRTSYAACVGGLVLLKGTVDCFNPKVVRATAGALFDLPILADIEAGELTAQLKKAGIKLVICEANAEKFYFEADLKEKVALVLGNEGQGVNETLKAAADESISIPMNPDCESLNVAISGGIILFEAQRQRLAVSNR